MNLGIIFGSRSAEHDVSIITGLQVLENADREKYNAFPIYISREGGWFVGEPLRDIKTYKSFDPNLKGLTRVILPPVPGLKGLYTLNSGGLFSKSSKVQDLECAILALHGMHGEDGCVQGLLELADIPYSSSGLVGSSVGMDKIMMKSVFKSMGLPVLDSIFFYRSQWRKTPDNILAKAEELGYPLYIKPANLGSSIGIGRAENAQSLRKAIEVAAEFDRRILVEKGLEKPVEVNCACMGFDGECTVSLCEQPVSWEDYLTFEDKYTRNAGKGMKSLARRIPAPISDEMTSLIQTYTTEIFRTLECKGIVRIDYLIDTAQNKPYVCEINTIPGSMAYYLFEPLGISFRQLVDRLVEYANKALAQKHSSTFAYDSQILNKAQKSQKTLNK